jgi:hypothetical protein
LPQDGRFQMRIGCPRLVTREKTFVTFKEKECTMLQLCPNMVAEKGAGYLVCRLLSERETR